MAPIRPPEQMLPERSTSIRLATSIPVMAETALMVVILLLFSEALLGPLLTDQTKPDDSPLLRLMWLPIYGIIITLAAIRFLPLANLTMRLPLLVGLILIIAASSTWSIEQSLTLRRTLAVAMTTAFGLHLASRYNWRELLALLGGGWLILCVGNFIVSLAVPSLGVESVLHVGAWKGMWFEKNTLGGHMSRATLLFGFLVITQPEHRRVWLIGLAMSVSLVLLSTSKTSLLGMLLGFLVLGLGWVMRRGPVSSLAMLWGVVTFGGLLVIIVITDPGFFFILLGRDPSLTGRTDIWEVLMDVIRERPVTGYGYGAFWNDGSDPATYVREITQWEVPTAHNGWLETWLGIGIGGLGLFVISFLVMIFRAVGTAFTSWNGFYALGFLLQFLLFSLSESIILQQNSITWVTYVAVTASLVQQKLGHEPLRLSGPRRNRDFILAN